VVAFDSEALVREGNFAADRVRAFAAIVVGPGGELKQIVEKPPQPEVYARDGKLWVNMNLFRFTPEIFDSCRSIEPNPERGELELPTAVSHLVESGRVPVRVMLAGGGVLDLTRRGDVASAERLLDGREVGF
jgi:dTDP-glucose pyrophosphorylase